jgi:hypothetical protein
LSSLRYISLIGLSDWFIFTGILFSKIFSLFESSEFDVIYENTTVGTVRDEHMTTVLPRNGSSTLKPPDVIHAGGGFISCLMKKIVSFLV